VLAHSFRTVRSTLRADLPSESRALEGARPRRLERRLVEAYTTDRRTRGGTALATIRALPGLRSKASYLWAMMVPSREFMAARTGSSRPSYLRRWLVPAGWVLRRGQRGGARP
jgi:hypothetical protein